MRKPHALSLWTLTVACGLGVAPLAAAQMTEMFPAKSVSPPATAAPNQIVAVPLAGQAAAKSAVQLPATTAPKKADSDRGTPYVTTCTVSPCFTEPALTCRRHRQFRSLPPRSRGPSKGTAAKVLKVSVWFLTATGLLSATLLRQEADARTVLAENRGHARTEALSA